MELFGEVAARLCNAATLLLGWRPNEFWETTPAELAIALQPPITAEGGPAASTIEALRLRFPDQGEVTNHG